MAYLGSKPQSGFISNAKERYTGITTAYVDLNHSIASLADVIVWVNFVKQDSTNLTLTSSTRITLGATLVASDIVEIAYLGKAVATQTPDTGTVTNDMLAGSIANSKLANSSITLNGSAVSLGGSATVGGDNTPMFSVRQTGTVNVTDNTDTKVAWNSELVDTDNAFASDKFTVPSGKAGKYFLYTMLLGQGSSGETLAVYYLNFFKNGSRIAMAEGDFRGYNDRKSTQTVTTIQDLSVGDYIEVYAKVDVTSGTPSYSGGDFQAMFGGYKLIT